MKKFTYLIYSLCLFLVSHPLLARDLESIATNLTSKTNRLAMVVGPIGFAIGSIFMFFGNPRGTQIMGFTLIGAVSVLGGSSVFNWLRNIAG